MSPRQPFLFEELERRIGRNHLARRLRLQVDHSAKFFGRGFGRFHWENIKILPLALEFMLKVSGLFRVGNHNVLDFEVVEVDVMVEGLPEAFEDFCILHLSDIHIDGMPDGG